MSDGKAIRGGDHFPLTHCSVIDAARSSDRVNRSGDVESLARFDTGMLRG
jgi:hypothetical protein